MSDKIYFSWLLSFSHVHAPFSNVNKLSKYAKIIGQNMENSFHVILR